MFLLVLFMSVALVISYIDIKSSLIPDKIIIPAILGLIVLKYLESSLSIDDFIAVIIIFIILMLL